jgi:hypothetical protein
MSNHLSRVLVITVLAASTLAVARSAVWSSIHRDVELFYGCQSLEAEELDDGKLRIADVARLVAAHCAKEYSDMVRTLKRAAGGPVEVDRPIDAATSAVEQERRAKFEARSHVEPIPVLILSNGHVQFRAGGPDFDSFRFRDQLLKLKRLTSSRELHVFAHSDAALAHIPDVSNQAARIGFKVVAVD